MEISLVGRSQVKPCRVHLAYRENGFCDFSSNNLDRWRSNLICSGQTILRPRSSVRLKVQASSTVHSEAVVSDSVSGDRKSKPMTAAGVMLFVGLPLDCVSDCNTINHARAIAAGLKALKLLGVDGVELPVWWGIAEKEAMGKYNWTGYLVLAELVEKMGLQLHISLCFHASKEPRIPLPEWVSRIGESQPGIFFTDRSGQHYKDCLSVGVDDLPVLEGRTPIQVYKEFCETFKDSFSHFLGYTIKSISIGLGPDGELRYPSHQNSSESKKSVGMGEFQCYDESMLTNLKQYAEAHQSPLWGLSGPHDASSYHQSPILSNFFKEHGGSWETPYGDFFLSWYSRQLLSHGDRLLSLAASTFCDTGVTVSGKVPLVHSWYRTRSHPSELMAGFYNTANRDGYEAFVKMFAWNSCKMMLSGMDLSDEYQPQESLSSPELLLAQINTACRKHGVEVYGQNSLNLGVTEGGFEKIKKNLVGENAMVDLFTYQRMGAYFFSPEHFPSFSELVRGLKQRALHSDDLMLDVEQTTKTSASMDLNMQTA